jgi:hypothetical protein
VQNIKQSWWQWVKTYFRLWIWSFIVVAIRGKLICPFCGEIYPELGYSHWHCENTDCPANGLLIYDDGHIEVIDAK